MSNIKHFLLNDIGRDFVVGDIHGCFTKLDEKLEEIGFDESKDRLFSVGDLVDRGGESEKSIEWLSKPWFHAVRGNHEQMAIDCAAGMYDAGHYMANGGAWFLGMTQQERVKYADEFRSMPIAIDVQTSHGLVGIVHAECPASHWSELRRCISDADESFIQDCLWSRERANNHTEAVIDGVTLVISGHTPMQRATKYGNSLFIDTGAVFGHKLTVIEIQSQIVMAISI
jgi:serine/threonine protein phosphatase 1